MGGGGGETIGREEGEDEEVEGVGRGGRKDTERGRRRGRRERG